MLYVIDLHNARATRVFVESSLGVSDLDIKVLNETIVPPGTVKPQESFPGAFLAVLTLPAEVEGAIASGTWSRDLSLQADQALVQAETRYELEFRGVQHG